MYYTSVAAPPQDECSFYTTVFPLIASIAKESSSRRTEEVEDILDNESATNIMMTQWQEIILLLPTKVNCLRTNLTERGVNVDLTTMLEPLYKKLLDYFFEHMLTEPNDDEAIAPKLTELMQHFTTMISLSPVQTKRRTNQLKIFIAQRRRDADISKSPFEHSTTIEKSLLKSWYSLINKDELEKKAVSIDMAAAPKTAELLRTDKVPEVKGEDFELATTSASTNRPIMAPAIVDFLTTESAIDLTPEGEENKRSIVEALRGNDKQLIDKLFSAMFKSNVQEAMLIVKSIQTMADGHSLLQNIDLPIEEKISIKERQAGELSEAAIEESSEELLIKALRKIGRIIGEFNRSLFGKHNIQKPAAVINLSEVLSQCFESLQNKKAFKVNRFVAFEGFQLEQELELWQKLAEHLYAALTIILRIKVLVEPFVSIKAAFKEIHTQIILHLPNLTTDDKMLWAPLADADPGESKQLPPATPSIIADAKRTGLLPEEEKVIREILVTLGGEKEGDELKKELLNKFSAIKNKNVAKIVMDVINENAEAKALLPPHFADAFQSTIVTTTEGQARLLGAVGITASKTPEEVSLSSPASTPTVGAIASLQQ